MEEIFHPSSKFTLSYYSSSKLKLRENGGGDGGELISAVYDSFYQSMTVTGKVGLAVATKDPNGNVIGSGIIGSDGTVTYPLNVEGLTNGTVIATSAQGSNVVEHSLVILSNNEEEIQEIENFDYAVIRYIWDAEDGSDLDTRTQITKPFIEDRVGWAVGNLVSAGSENSGIQDNYLTWGGDNRQYGVESVLLDLKLLAANNPNHTDIFEITLRTFWYLSVDLGNITLELETYRGGVMQDDGFNYINVGGEQVQTLQTTHNIFIQQSSNIPGQTIGYIRYDSATGKTTLVKQLAVYSPLTVTVDNFTEMSVTSDTPQGYTVTHPDGTVHRFSSFPEVYRPVYLDTLRNGSGETEPDGIVFKIQNIIPDSPIIDIILSSRPKPVTITEYKLVDWETDLAVELSYIHPYGLFNGDLYRSTSPFDSSNVLTVAQKVATDLGNNKFLDASVEEGITYYYMVVIDLNRTDFNGNPLYSYSNMISLNGTRQDISIVFDTVSYQDQTVLMPIRGYVQFAKAPQTIKMRIDNYIRPDGDAAPVWDVSLDQNGRFALTVDQSYDLVKHTSEGNRILQVTGLDVTTNIGNKSSRAGSAFVPNKTLRRYRHLNFVPQLNATRYVNGKWWALGDSSLTMVSENGGSWTSLFTNSTFGYGTGESFNTMLYGNGAYVASARDGADCAVSADGVTWTYRRNNMPIAKPVSFAHDRFFDKGLNYKTDILSTTAYAPAVKPAGSNWNYDLTAIYLNGVWLAYSYYGILRSTNGVNWTDIGFSNTKVRYLLILNGTFFMSNEVGWHKSVDGLNWTAVVFGVVANTAVNKIIYGHAGFLAVGANGLTMTSPDGVVWTIKNIGVPTGVNLSSDAYQETCTYGDGTYYVAWGRNLVTSKDLETWSNPLLNVTATNITNILAANGALVINTAVETPAATVMYLNLPPLT